MRDPRQVADYSDSDVTVGIRRNTRRGSRPSRCPCSVRSSMGPKRSAQTLLKLNQADGFDCISCAWPDPEVGHRHSAEFCENGAKAVAEEATTARATPELFAAHSIADLDQHSEWWLGQQGRITEPMVKRPGATHYSPIDWDEAFRIIADELNATRRPRRGHLLHLWPRLEREALSPTSFSCAHSARTTCPTVRHVPRIDERRAAESIGIGKASVSIEDVYHAQLIIVAGQNPGTNHPRMLSALEIAKRNGATIVSINPLREAGLVAFKNPQNARGWSATGPSSPTCISPSRSTGILRCSRRSGRCSCSGTRWTRTSSVGTPRGHRVENARQQHRLGDGHRE